MIRHVVIFTLRHPEGGPEEAAFLADALVLATIPGVLRFERLRQTSPKTDYAFSFSMEFADRAAYEAYNSHPDHVSFVRDRWAHEVSKFLEIDTVPLTPGG